MEKDWNKKYYNETFPLDVDIKQNLDKKMNEAMRKNNEDLVTRAMDDNELKESLILEKIAAQKEAEKKIF